MSRIPALKIFLLVILMLFMKTAYCQTNEFEEAIKMKMDSLAKEPERFVREELVANDAMQNLMKPSG